MQIRNQNNYGGLVIPSNLELMYFKIEKEKAQTIYQFGLYFLHVFEADGAALPLDELKRQTITGTNNLVFQNDNNDLFAAVENQLRKPEILNIAENFEIVTFEVDGFTLTIEAETRQRDGTQQETKKKSDYNGGFTQVIRASGELLAGVYEACLKYHVAKNPHGVIAQAIAQGVSQ